MVAYFCCRLGNPLLCLQSQTLDRWKNSQSKNKRFQPHLQLFYSPKMFTICFFLTPCPIRHIKILKNCVELPEYTYKFRLIRAIRFHLPFPLSSVFINFENLFELELWYTNKSYKQVQRISCYFSIIPDRGGCIICICLKF